MKVRELRVTDIRCRADGCGAGPGEPCRKDAQPHLTREGEHAALVAQGWEWQEVDPTDLGVRGPR